MYKKISINTFVTGELSGSLQHLHIFDTLDQRNKLFSSYIVIDDTDHSFIHFANNILNIRWKNKAGEIQFCGSGAYAASWLYLQDPSYSDIILQSPIIKLTSHESEDQVFLSIPKKPTEYIERYIEHKTYVNKEVGIYLIELQSLDDLKSAEFTTFERYLGQVQNIHGLCLFHWNTKENIGHVRYFTPWHGRDEDSVTGSIHQYLSPLVEKKYYVKKQRWTQLSHSKGEVNTMINNDCVTIYGRCSQNEKSFQL